MSHEVAIQPAGQNAYELRRQMLGRLTQAQGLEHVFYEACRETVKEASTRLAEYFSRLIQTAMPRWSLHDANQFSQHTTVPMEALAAWRQSFDELMRCQAELSEAQLAVRECKAQRREVSGVIFGAKTGKELDYRTATERLQTAEARQDVCTTALKAATESATQCAERLLDACMANAARLAEVQNYEPANAVKAILVSAAERAKELTSNYQMQQRALNREIQLDLDALNQLIGVPSGN
jgi:hypothetical protein